MGHGIVVLLKASFKDWVSVPLTPCSSDFLSDYIDEWAQALTVFWKSSSSCDWFE